jgi:osmotically-inducible protein OsmY
VWTGCGERPDLAREDGMATRGSRAAKPEILEDDELQQLISEKIDEDPAFWTGSGKRRPTIVVEVEDGFVTLSGVVRTALDSRRADILARALGAAGVDNRLRTLEGSGENDQLKRRSA